MGKPEVTERLLVQIWKAQLIDGEKLATAEGKPLRVLYPGKENREEGPDFLGAVISAGNGELLRGDVEVHARANDWRSHGHHRDPRYNGVVLQVAWDGDAAAALESGRRVPTLCLRGCLRGSLEHVRRCAALPEARVEPCHDASRRLGEGEMGRLLDEAGDERLRLKARRFGVRMAEEPPDQTLYRGLMRALGYSRNAESFEELASRQPLAALEQACRGDRGPKRALVLRALLLGKAGLLPASGEPLLARLWRSLGDGEEMTPACWHTFRVRPDNQPVRRLGGAAHLLARFTKTGLASGVLRPLVELGGTPQRLEASFVVSGPSRSGEGSSLIGWGRARDIAINVALPFALAWAQASGEEELAERSLRLYRAYPRAADNSVTRGLSGLMFPGSSSKLVCSARRQQGLLHLDAAFCRQRRCSECPVAVGSPSQAFGG